MATIPTQTGERTATRAQAIPRAATIEDAQLIVQILAAGSASGADRGSDVLFSYGEPVTLEKLRDEYPPLSKRYSYVMACLGQAEMIATFVKQGLLSETLVHDLFWVEGMWKVSEQVCRGLREETGEPRLYENFEWLASRAT